MGKEIIYYTAKKPYIFNRLISDKNAKQISSEIFAPFSHLHRSNLQAHSSPHQHDYFEVIYVISGEIIQIIENVSIHYHAGECCILNRNICHSEVYFTEAEVIFMMLTEEFLNPLVDKNFIYSTNNIYSNTFDSISLLINQNQRCKYYTTKKYINFSPLSSASDVSILLRQKETINNILNATLSQLDGCEFIIAGLISRFFSLLEDSSKYKKNIISLTKANDEKLLVRITSLFEETKGHISRQELSEKLHYNADYLNRVVKLSTGLTLTEYQHLFQLEEAAYLLKFSTKSISKIITELGFSNHTYFNKIFFQKYGMNPSSFRHKYISSDL